VPPAAPEKKQLKTQEKKHGVCYALTAQGQELPVIDVTHPAFRVADDPDSVEALKRASDAETRKQRKIPRFLMRFLFRSMIKRSALLRSMFVSGGPVLPGMSTYMTKLGADNLVPPFDGPTDRRFAALPGLTSIRIRLQQTAKLLAEGIEPELTRRPGVPLHLLNIGGGSGIDSLNALILLQRSSPELLRRSITLHLLDPDTNGPTFSRNALAALRGSGAVLEGVDVQFIHRTYDWNQPTALAQLIGELAATAIVAASSEGALFEYGSDEAITANLRALHAGGRGAVAIAGSVTHDDELIRRAVALGPFKLIPRGLERFAALIRGTGFTIAHVERSLMSDQVRLKVMSDLF
jgi:hypothetical protein